MTTTNSARFGCTMHVLMLTLAMATGRGAAATAPDLAARVALEEVRWRHRSWPEENLGRKPDFPSQMVESRLRARIGDDGRKLAALASVWGVEITRADLQREIDRMARDSRDPLRLREMWSALGNDPASVGVSLALPLILERRIRERFDADPGAAGASRGTSFDAWWAEARGRFAPLAAAIPSGLSLPATLAGRCVAGTWAQTSAAAPVARSGHAAVWTGSEMIVWGGVEGSYLDSGARYDPAADTWTPIATDGAPTGRFGHTAVWTGSAMIVYGGRDVLASIEDGGSYDPASDTWTEVPSIPGASGQRAYHTAVWTGTEMIVWGGVNLALFSPVTYRNGGRWNPATQSWSFIGEVGGPSARFGHTAVWTGTEMVVWGGENEDHFAFSWTDTGGRFDPRAGAWTATQTRQAPLPRSGHSAVWTGNRMIVWGGSDGSSGVFAYATGGVYEPAHDRWSSLPASGAPSARAGHTAIWTGSKMLVWGGETSAGSTATGAAYDAASGVWSAIASAGAPAARSAHTSIWTGSRMIVFGGQLPGGSTFSSGGRYDPESNTWTPTSGSDVVLPPARSGHLAVWTGSEMIVWGGVRGVRPLADGYRYEPAIDAWSPIAAAGQPSARQNAAAVWTGSEWIVWGGEAPDSAPAQLDSGGRYDPALDVWTATSVAGVPSPRALHRATWTGSEMIVWGGNDASGGYTGTGGRYDPVSDSWRSVATIGAPDPRELQSQVWDGRDLIVWGGQGFLCCHVPGSGARYDPAADAWTPTVLDGAPLDRTGDAFFWSGDRFVVWGGTSIADGSPLDAGGRYDPIGDIWSAAAEAPIGPRRLPSSAWVCGGLMVWGGDNTDGPSKLSSIGASYDPFADAWTPTGPSGAPSGRTAATLVAAGARAIAWGGRGSFAETATGGIYCACATAQVPRAVDRVSVDRGVDAGEARLSWEAAADATGYDVVRGELSALRASGSIGASGAACFAAGLPTSSVVDDSVPAPQDGFWYLVRARNDAGAGTYDDGSSSQIEPRALDTCGGTTLDHP